METKTIIIDEELNDKIRYLQYEYESRKDIISYMISSGIDISNERFTRYQDEATEWFIQYNEAKKEMLDKYVGKSYKGSWNLDFDSATLTLY